MPDSHKPDPVASRFCLSDPTGIEIDGQPRESWLKAYLEMAAAQAPKPPAKPAGSCPPPEDHPATAMSDDSGPQAKDNLVFFDFDFE